MKSVEIVNVDPADTDNCVLAGLRDRNGTKFFALPKQQPTETRQHG